ncbi:MAG: type II toxin-antitoxin system RelE/ParE family toxin [Candidatus Obscuribacter sp.]|nr:type II toxin-antitoxin system RelE/ParE family toxin [Candidatus Obscuribacter sp.]
MEEELAKLRPRAFKTEWFAKAADKVKITDSELCKAIKQVRLGQCDDLGGGVFKKRLNKNMHRSIIVAKGGKYWVYAYLFAKKDRENIDQKELDAFRELADLYETKTDRKIEKELGIKVLVEICHGEEI